MTKNTTPLEHLEQLSYVSWFEQTFPAIRLLAIPNGSHRHKAVAAKLKQEGVKRGVPDLFIPEWMLWVEMKRQKGGRLSTEQKEWIEYLSSVGYTCIVGYGWEDAMTKTLAFASDKGYI